jgi:hypothetical protein
MCPRFLASAAHPHLFPSCIYSTLAMPGSSQILQFTHTTVVSNLLPILDPLQPATQCCSTTDGSVNLCDLPPHLDLSSAAPPNLLVVHQPVTTSQLGHPTVELAPPAHTKMSTKLDIPVLTGVLNAPNINSWLNLCQDSFEVCNELLHRAEACNPDCPLWAQDGGPCSKELVERKS